MDETPVQVLQEDGPKRSRNRSCVFIPMLAINLDKFDYVNINSQGLPKTQSSSFLGKAVISRWTAKQGTKKCQI